MQTLPSLSVIQESDSSLLRRRNLEAELDADRRARHLFVPTIDADVKIRLRELGVPICLFGEKPEDRVVRLRHILARAGPYADFDEPMMVESGIGPPAESPETGVPSRPFFSKGSLALSNFRADVLRSSFVNASSRLSSQKALQSPLFGTSESATSYLRSEILSQRSFFGDLSQVDLGGSVVGDRRPVSVVCLRGRSEAICGSWSGFVKVWRVSDLSCRKVRMLKAHRDRVTGIAVPPVPSSFVFCTGGADRFVRVWGEKGKKPLCEFGGSFHRLGRVAVHPDGRHIAAASFDMCWFLYEVGVGKQEILAQEGHSSEVYDVAFHPDGSLVASTDFGGIVRLWDLRTGRSVMNFSHTRKCLAAAFAPNGYHLATGGDDNQVRIWNLRVRRPEHVIYAHTKLISDLKYEPVHGRYLVTSSYDQTLRIWKNISFGLVRTLHGHESLVMSCDVAQHSEFSKVVDPLIVSCGYDKTWKLWMRGGGGANAPTADGDDDDVEMKDGSEREVKKSERMEVD